MDSHKSTKIRNIITRQLTVTVTSVFLLVLVIIGSSYALFMEVDTSEQQNVYTSGDLVMVFNDVTGENKNTINNSALIPMNNELALKQTNNIYSFTITNTGTLPMKYDVLLSDIEKYKNGNLLNHEYIKYQLCIKNMDNCTIIRDLSTVEDGVIYQSNLTAGEQTIYYLRVWITDENIPNDAQEKEVHLEVNINGISANDTYLAYYLTDNAKVKQSDINNWYASDNNYINFDGETWRIIGVFNKLSNGESVGSRIKIIKDTPLVYDYEFDKNTNIYMNSSLKTALNESYFNTISEKYRILAEPIMIDNVATNVFLMNKTDIDKCSWLKSTIDEYTMTASDEVNQVLSYNNGKVESSNITNVKKVRPVLFLSEMTEYLGGTGTPEDPYIIVK